MAARITSAEFGEKVLNAEKPVLVDFYSDSCVPCKMLSPVLSQLESELDGKLDIYKVNVGYEQELVDKYEVQASPTLIFFRNGGEVSRIRGAAKKADILAEFEKLQ
ncbi:MAG: thioredoxin fold domain-containing protein [Ruminiclostridium sp.]|nr:thioredoxin fold domain-containing protein [Ruminiclostridium sp.]